MLDILWWRIKWTLLYSWRKPEPLSPELEARLIRTMEDAFAYVDAVLSPRL